jgi:hypothetical protein
MISCVNPDSCTCLGVRINPESRINPDFRTNPNFVAIQALLSACFADYRGH